MISTPAVPLFEMAQQTVHQDGVDLLEGDLRGIGGTLFSEKLEEQAQAVTVALAGVGAEDPIGRDVLERLGAADLVDAHEHGLEGPVG